MGKSVFITEPAPASAGHRRGVRRPRLHRRRLRHRRGRAGHHGREHPSTGGTVLTGHLDVTDYDENVKPGIRIRANERQPARRDDQQRRHPGVGPLRGDRRRRQPQEIDVNCKGTVNGLYAAFPYLRSTPSAVVVNLASASAIYGQAELAVYSSTKFFVRGLTEALNLEWQRHDIRVIDMCRCS